MNDALKNLLELYGCVAAFTLMILNGTISAPPSELVLVTAGILASQGRLSFGCAVSCAVAGNLLGALILFSFGRLYGEERLSMLRRRLIRSPGLWRIVAKAIPDSALVADYGARVRAGRSAWIFYLRCVPVVRSIISVPAGIFRVHPLRFILLSSAGMTLWAMTWIAGGYLIGEVFLKISVGLTIVVMMSLLAIVLIFLPRLHRD